MSNSNHIIIWGSDGLAERLVEHLAPTHSLVVVTEEYDNRVATTARKLGVRVVIGEPDSETLEAADIRTAKLIALVEDDDVQVLRVGLLVDQSYPGIEVVMRMYRTELAGGVANMTNATVLSAAEICAPILLDLCVSPHDRVFEKLEAKRLLSDRPWFYLRRNQTLTLIISVLLITLLSVNVVIDHIYLKHSWIDAITNTVSMSFGNLNIEEIPIGVKLFSLFTIFIGAFAVGGLLTIGQQKAVNMWLSSEFNKLPIPERNHVIVFGSGKIGTRLVEQLHWNNVPVIAVDENLKSLGASYCRQNRLPFVEGSSTDFELLENLNIQTARAVVIITDDDIVNLECAMLVWSIRPDIKAVVRTFEPGLAERLDAVSTRSRNISISGVSAPVFGDKIKDLVV